MTSSAISAQGSGFAINTGTDVAPVLTPVKNVKSYSGFDGAATSLDATDLDSTAKENLLGLQDWGAFSIDVNIDYADPGQAAMLASKRTSTKKEYTLTLPNGYTAKFTASVNSFPIAGATDAIITSTIAMTISGDVVITAPAQGGA
jgi:Lambda phage tail tube protein, TTP